MQALGNPAKGEHTSNPYTRLLVDSLPEDEVATVYFRWAGFLTDRFDVFHTHWPELLLRHRIAPIRWAKCLAFLVFLTRLRIQRKAIVRTVHNLSPHEDLPWLVSKVVHALDRRTTLRIVLNERTPLSSTDPSVLIPHGHYRDWYAEPPADQIVSGRFLTFGLIRAYKGIDELVKAFSATDSTELSLTIAGRPDSKLTADITRDLSSADARINLNLKFLPDDELVKEISEAALVVLPYREVHNSGVALLALSMNRPILVRDAPATRLLVDEFGTGWVNLFSGELSAHALEAALKNSSSITNESRVDMSSRDWDVLASKLVDAYREALEIVAR